VTVVGAAGAAVVAVGDTGRVVAAGGVVCKRLAPVTALQADNRIMTITAIEKTVLRWTISPSIKC
jgi:hypothetical protein